MNTFCCCALAAAAVSIIWAWKLGGGGITRPPTPDPAAAPNRGDEPWEGCGGSGGPSRSTNGGGPLNGCNTYQCNYILPFMVSFQSPKSIYLVTDQSLPDHKQPSPVICKYVAQELTSDYIFAFQYRFSWSTTKMTVYSIMITHSILKWSQPFQPSSSLSITFEGAHRRIETMR